MPELTWKEAIVAVLKEAKEPLHYQEITERILTDGLKTTDGATPSVTVYSQIAISLKSEGAKSPFIRVAKGTFSLTTTVSPTKLDVEEDTSDEVIKAFGVYWQRDLVVWRSQAKLFGRQQAGARSVDFAEQRGVYALYDHHSIVYVGRSVDRPLGRRLFEHTLDRLSGRWNRFSWFGLRGVASSGKLENSKCTPSFDVLVSTLEAILIETL